MSWLVELARREIRALRAYEHAVWEPGWVRLHANELPWRAHGDGSAAGLNRYPEPHPHQLTAALADFYGVPATMLLAGRGSDELIDLLIRSYCQAGRDAIVICPPTFGMYAVAARIQGAAIREVPLRAAAGWQLDAAAVRRAVLGDDGVASGVGSGTANASTGAGASGDAAPSETVKLVFLCSPNNPTGNRLDGEAIIALARALQGHALVVVDEAYVEFAGDDSLLPQVAATPGLVVLRTLSKAHGLAGARCGVAVAAPEVIALLRKVIQPYAVTQPTIEAVLAALQREAVAQTRRRIATLCAERTRVAEALRANARVRRLWPSDANFLLVEFIDAGAALERAHQAGLLLRDLRQPGALEQCLRISIGSPEQNDWLLESLR